MESGFKAFLKAACTFFSSFISVSGLVAQMLSSSNTLLSEWIILIHVPIHNT